MRTIYLFLLLSINCIASNLIIDKPVIKKNNTTVVSKPNNTYISGLKIVSYDSSKLGKHIYVISDIYTKKKVTFYNEKGEKIYSKSTIGSPIYLSRFDKGTYTLKIVEGKKTEMKEFIIN